MVLVNLFTSDIRVAVRISIYFERNAVVRALSLIRALESRCVRPPVDILGGFRGGARELDWGGHLGHGLLGGQLRLARSRSVCVAERPLGRSAVDERR